MLNPLYLNFGITWTKQSLVRSCLKAITILFISAVVITSSCQYRYAVSHYQEMVHRANYWYRAKENYQARLIDCLNGGEIASEPAGYKIKRVYFCNLMVIPFGSK